MGFWRSVGHSHAAFYTESFIDELAHAAGSDPVEFRRNLLHQAPRHRAVLDAVARAAAWGSVLASGVARGVALHESFGSIVAQVAEVELRKGAIHVRGVVVAIDCGYAVNPDGVRAQMESGVVFGLSAALFGAITVRAGKVEQSNFHNYPVLRAQDAPSIEVHIVASHGPMGGVGEPGTPPIAPAVANAVFALSGKRLRELPLKLA